MLTPPTFDWTTVLQWFPIIFSMIALLISSITLWKGYLSPFGLEMAHAYPRLSLYKITPRISGTKNGKTWWIPSFDVGLTFHNKGQRIGRVKDIRVVCLLRSGKSSKTIILSAQWVISYASFMRDHHNRMKWLCTSVEREWYPLIMSARETKHLHVILEGERLDDTQTGEMEYRLEVLSSDSEKWKECAIFRLGISEDMYESGSTYTGSTVGKT